MTESPNTRTLAGALKAADFSNHSVVVGFDAFIDENVRIVESRSSVDAYASMKTISDFGSWATRASGRSGGREYVIQELAPGGCSLNLGDGLAALGLPVDAYLGVGDPPHRVFAEVSARFRSIQSLGMGPGRSFVLQFNDGKLILGNFDEIFRVDEDFLRSHIPQSDYSQRCREASAIVFTCWSVYPHLSACWKYLATEVLHDLAQRPNLFFDLADPVQRSVEDILELVERLRDWEKVGPVTLSLNDNEAEILSKTAGGPDRQGSSTIELASWLRGRIAISRVVIHSLLSATCSSASGVSSAPVDHCASPVKTVGGGDRFNAGFLAGLVLDRCDSECLILGNACSGHFVRTARSATLEDVIPNL